MLVLSRKINESIRISDNIAVKIVEINGNRVRLAIDAPRDVTVDRAEIQERRRQFMDIDLAGVQR